MVAKSQENRQPKNRRQISGNKSSSHGSASKKPKFVNDKPSKSHGLGTVGKPFKSKVEKSEAKKEPITKREHRLQAKELAEARKKKRKRHYDLEHELAHLWEKMRVRNITKEDRSKWVSKALENMKGKIPEIAGSHVSSRVLQTCVKHCTDAEREAVFEELKPHFLTLACNTYAVHLVKKMLDNASKKQLAGFISSLHGHVASLLRHMVGSLVVEHAYHLANAAQKQTLLLELYSVELQLFKDLVSMKESRLVDVISKLDIKKASVSRHMTSVIQPILEKGIVDHSIIHRVLMEYFTIADKTSAADVIQHLSSSLLVRMIHTKDGSRIGVLCIKHGSAKERKKIVKGMKGHVKKIAHEQYAVMVLVSIISVVDDTKLIRKIIINELEKDLKELILDKNGRRVVLQLLRPNCSRYFSPDDLASLNLSIPSLCNKSESGVDRAEEKADSDMGETEGEEVDGGEVSAEGSEAVEGGKKDPLIRRHELLVDSGLAEKLVDVCVNNAGEILRSNFGREVMYEVTTGGADDVLQSKLGEKLSGLYEAIASLAAEPKSEDAAAGDEHVLENFHSSRTIRKLILDCPAFALTLWTTALEGKSKLWAQGHSCKIVQAFLESTDSKVREISRVELQSLIDEGLLKIPDTKQSADKS
ncbi:pumilio homolog 24 [Cucurbita moschata]|uniref:Pumilio homolog 24 n=1 Tax=Cucurbita moschata TaxID=3662 RepID=A0A6J1EQN8_CUCMO|nr:pumilio homolog 24 [Cucurbita moschata]XP_022930492.1 pumilio homolog 24 [Cucurbita moschata]XP_022930493.1 pumilio homolog 24 [Cucurbita moschata]